MLGRLVVLVVAAAVLPALGTTAAAAPAAPTCQGRPATIVGSPGERVFGTDGPDVIVSRGAKLVRGEAGDDRICVTGPRPARGQVRVLAQDGDDRVTVDVDRRTTTIVQLGQGDDTLVGGPGPEIVQGLPGRDVVRTGGGADHLRIFGAEPVDDVVSLGAGADRVIYTGAGMTDTAELDGDAGRDYLYLGRDAGGAPMLVDNAAGELRIGGVTDLRWEAFEELEVSPFGASRLDLVGGPRPEKFVVPFFRVDSARLGGGDDVLGFYVPELTDGAVLDGGAGRDHLAPSRTQGTAHIDLAADEMRFSDPAVTARVPRFENASVTARRVRLRGDAGPNRLAGFGCDTRVLGGAGSDVLAYARQFQRVFDCRIRTVLRGGPGADLLLGGPRADLLYGGAGTDRARAGGGRDLCRGIEKRKGCERR